MIEIIQKRDALSRGITTYFTGKPCKHGHISPRFINSVCVECGRLKKIEWYQKNKNAADFRAKEWRQRERLLLISLFGGACVHCGETDPIVLDFDHINNDGHKESGKNIIFSVKQNPSKFQLLCKNCNWKKEYWRRKNA